MRSDVSPKSRAKLAEPAACLSSCILHFRKVVDEKPCDGYVHRYNTAPVRIFDEGAD